MGIIRGPETFLQGSLATFTMALYNSTFTMASAKGSFLQSNQSHLASPMSRMVGYPIAYSFSKLPPSNWASASALHRSKGTRHAFYMTSIIHPSHPLRRRELALPTAASLAPRKPPPHCSAHQGKRGEKSAAGRLRLVKK